MPAETMPSSAHIARCLAAIVGRAHVRLDPPRPAPEGPPPDVVVRPAETGEIADILRYANAARVPLFPASGRGSARVRGGIVLDLRRMQTLGSVDEPNRLVHAQPGVRLDGLYRALAAAGFLCPLDPVGALPGTLGGAAALAGDALGLGLYGAPLEHIAGIEAVLGTGEVLRAPAPASRASHGAARLLLGSRGALAVLTRLTLRLRRAPEAAVALRAAFASPADAGRAAAATLEHHLPPAALAVFAGAACAAFGPPPPCALAMVELHVPRAALAGALGAAERAFRAHGGRLEASAHAPQDRHALWTPLRTIEATYDGLAPCRRELLVRLLPNRVPEFLEEAVAADRPGVVVACAARPDLGEVRVALLHPEVAAVGHAAESVAEELAALAVELGGAALGADGAPRSAADLCSEEMKLLRQLKEVFDPNGILNPGAWLPGETLDGHEG